LLNILKFWKTRNLYVDKNTIKRQKVKNATKSITRALDSGAQRAETPPRPKSNSNPDLWINPVPDPVVCRIAPKMYWIHSLVSMSHFANYRKNRPVTV